MNTIQRNYNRKNKYFNITKVAYNNLKLLKSKISDRIILGKNYLMEFEIQNYVNINKNIEDTIASLLYLTK